VKINQAARNLIRLITAGEGANLENGLCCALLHAGADYPYRDITAVFGCRSYSDEKSSPAEKAESFGAAGDFNEHRMTALALVAALSDDDIDHFLGVQ
jgi:hypothetical protein